MNFPIMCIDKNPLKVFYFEPYDNFKVADINLVEKGVFNNIEIIDSDGVVYKINKIEKIKWATPFLGYSLTIKGRLAVFHFEFEKKNIINVNNLKDYIINAIGSKHWQFHGINYKSEIQPKIDSSNSIKDLILLFK